MQIVELFFIDAPIVEPALRVLNEESEIEEISCSESEQLLVPVPKTVRRILYVSLFHPPQLLHR